MAKNTTKAKAKKVDEIATSDTVATATTDKDICSENESLKKQMEEMKAQMEAMSKMLAEAKSAPIAEKSGVNKDRNITFVNLTNGTAVLRGNSFWKLEGRFASRTFLEREARIIVNNMPNMIRSGMVYITDAQFVEDNDLSEVYLNILSDKDLKELLSHDASYIVDVYKNVSDGQKNIIIDMIVDKVLAGEKVDNNVLVELGRLSGKDLINIEK